MGKIPIYSPRQVATAAFVGGPLAMVFTLKKNFDALGDSAKSKQTLIWGGLFVLLLFIILPVLPDKFPNYVIPAAYTMTSLEYVKRYQLTKEAIANSEQYAFRSNWNVFGLSVGFLVIFLAVFVVWYMGLVAVGLVTAT